ncbi:unnamed protein product [Sphagnum balticum]
MIVLTILSLAFGIAYATANDGLDRSRNAEEHSEALGLLQAQVELTRAAFADNQDLTTYNVNSGVNDSFCLLNPNDTTPTNPVFFGSYQVPQNPVSDILASANPTTAQAPYPTTCTSGLYYTSITYRTPASGQPYFDFLVRWQGEGNLGIQQEELTYKISDLANSISGQAYVDNAPPIACPSGTVGPSEPNCTTVPPVSFSWEANGDAYTQCTNGTDANVVDDGYNGCKGNSPATFMYSYRDVNITYSLTSGVISGTVSNPTSNPISVPLTIAYRQYDRDGVQAPSNYCYQVNAYINGSSTAAGSACLTPGSSFTPQSSQIAVTIPANTAATSLELDWTNDQVDSTGDANIEIDQLSLAYPSALAIPQPEAVFPVESCDSGSCGTAPGGGEYTCGNGTITIDTSGLTAGTKYHVTVLYSNYNGCAAATSPPSSYNYTGTIYSGTNILTALFGSILGTGSLYNSYSWPFASVSSPAYSFTATDSNTPINIYWDNNAFIGTTRYSFVLNRELGTDQGANPDQSGDSNVNTPHVLWRDTMKSASACVPVNIALSDPNTDTTANSTGDGYEMMAAHMRLTKFIIEPTTTKGSVYSINIWTAFGDSDLLDGSNQFNCNGGVGEQYCATSQLNSSVTRRAT